jgi:hypothetical protein
MSPQSKLLALFRERADDVERVLGAELKGLTADVGDYKHFHTARGFGVTFKDVGEPCHVRLAAKLADSNKCRQDGIIRHELGHVVDLSFPEPVLDRWALSRGVQLPPKSQGEIRADAIAEAIWGSKLGYDDATVQNVCEGVQRRPAHLGL